MGFRIDALGCGGCGVRGGGNNNGSSDCKHAPSRYSQHYCTLDIATPRCFTLCKVENSFCRPVTFSDGNFVTAQSANIWASCFKKVLNAVVKHEKSPIPGDLF